MRCLALRLCACLFFAGFSSLRPWWWSTYLRWFVGYDPVVVVFFFLRYTPSPRGAGLVFAVVFSSLKYALPLEVSLVFLKLGASSFPVYVLLLLDFIRRCGYFRLYAALRLRLVMCGDLRLL